MTDSPYDHDFYADLAAATEASARAVLAVVIDLVGPPATAVDVGCGTGVWLRALAALTGCAVTGVDGSGVPEAELVIPADRFVARDLVRPLDLDGRFDLALSLEVAEHLPASRADGLVADLVGLAPAVLFSAAVPGQGGVHHVNEQWPSYWIERFAACGYQAWDGVRPVVWDDPEVAFYYAQNAFLFVDPDVFADRAVAPAIADLVHPGLLRGLLAATEAPTLGQLGRALPAAAARSARFHARSLGQRRPSSSA